MKEVRSFDSGHAGAAAVRGCGRRSIARYTLAAASARRAGELLPQNAPMCRSAASWLDAGVPHQA
jgi:hypothetical protein